MYIYTKKIAVPIQTPLGSRTYYILIPGPSPFIYDEYGNIRQAVIDVLAVLLERLLF